MSQLTERPDGGSLPSSDDPLPSAAPGTREFTTPLSTSAVEPGSDAERVATLYAKALDADLPPPKVASMEEIIAAALWQPRFNLLLLNVFAGLALVLGILAAVYLLLSRKWSKR